MPKTVEQEKVDEELSVEIPEEKGTEVEIEDKEVPDPGAEEGMPKKKVFVDEDGKPGPDHPKYIKIWGQLKESKREVELLKQGGRPEDKHLVKEMQLHNKRLAEALEKQTNAMEESNKISKDKVGTDALADNKKAQADLKTAKATAREESDYTTMDSIDDQLLELRMAERDLKEPPKETKKEVEPEKTVETAIPKDQQDIIDDWAKEDAPWYQGKSSTDKMKTSAAVSAERELQEDPEWKDKPYGEQLKEVQRRVEEAFAAGEKKPDLPEPTEKTTGLSGVESSGGNRGEGKQRKVVLNADQVRVARGFGMTPEEYARQMDII